MVIKNDKMAGVLSILFYKRCQSFQEFPEIRLDMAINLLLCDAKMKNTSAARRVSIDDIFLARQGFASFEISLLPCSQGHQDNLARAYLGQLSSVRKFSIYVAK